MLRKTVEDVERLLTALTGAVSKRRRGVAEDDGQIDDYEYARRVLAAAEPDLRKLGMYEETERAINDSERLMQAGRFDEADDVLLNTAREMMKKSGTYERMAAEYGKPGKGTT